MLYTHIYNLFFLSFLWIDNYVTLSGEVSLFLLNFTSVCSRLWTDQLQIFRTALGDLLQHHFLLSLVQHLRCFITLVRLFSSSLFSPLSLSFILLIFSGVKLLVLGSMQGMHNIHGSFNIPNMQGTLTSRNSSINNVPSGGVQQPSGTLSSGRFASNNLPVALSQVLVCFYCVIQHVLYSVNKGYRNVISVRYLLTSRMCSVNQTCGQTNMFCIKCIKEVPGTAFEEHLCAFENFSQLMCLTKWNILAFSFCWLSHKLLCKKIHIWGHFI